MQTVSIRNRNVLLRMIFFVTASISSPLRLVSRDVCGSGEEYAAAEDPILRLIARKYGHDMHSENTMHEKLAFAMNWHQKNMESEMPGTAGHSLFHFSFGAKPRSFF